MNHFFRSVGFAWRGIATAWASERNLKVQSGIAVVVIMAGVYFDITAIEWILLLMNVGIVMSLELLNSAIEDLVDLVMKERHPLAGKVKDIAAGAVLFFAVIALITGIIIFQKYILP